MSQSEGVLQAEKLTSSVPGARWNRGPFRSTSRCADAVAPVSIVCSSLRSPAQEPAMLYWLCITRHAGTAPGHAHCEERCVRVLTRLRERHGVACQCVHRLLVEPGAVPILCSLHTHDTLIRTLSSPPSNILVSTGCRHAIEDRLRCGWQSSSSATPWSARLQALLPMTGCIAGGRALQQLTCAPPPAGARAVLRAAAAAAVGHGAAGGALGGPLLVQLHAQLGRGPVRRQHAQEQELPARHACWAHSSLSHVLPLAAHVKQPARCVLEGPGAGARMCSELGSHRKLQPAAG